MVVSGRVRDRGEIGELVGRGGDGDSNVDAETKAKTGNDAAADVDANATPTPPSRFTAWTKGYSIVGQGAEAHVVAMGAGVVVGEVRVEQGDWLVCELEEEAVVRVPRGLVERVLKWAETRKAQDAKAMEWVRNGGQVGEGLKRFRGKIEV